jgi:hypothetical protein
LNPGSFVKKNCSNSSPFSSPTQHPRDVLFDETIKGPISENETQILLSEKKTVKSNEKISLDDKENSRKEFGAPNFCRYMKSIQNLSSKPSDDHHQPSITPPINNVYGRKKLITNSSIKSSEKSFKTNTKQNKNHIKKPDIIEICDDDDNDDDDDDDDQYEIDDERKSDFKHITHAKPNQIQLQQLGIDHMRRCIADNLPQLTKESSNAPILDIEPSLESFQMNGEKLGYYDSMIVDAVYIGSQLFKSDLERYCCKVDINYLFHGVGGHDTHLLGQLHIHVANKHDPPTLDKSFESICLKDIKGMRYASVINVIVAVDIFRDHQWFSKHLIQLVTSMYCKHAFTIHTRATLTSRVVRVALQSLRSGRLNDET